MYVLLRNCRVHIPDPWRYPAPAKIDTGVGYIPTNRPAKTQARVAPETQPTTGFFHGCRALVLIIVLSTVNVALSWAEGCSTWMPPSANDFLYGDC